MSLISNSLAFYEREMLLFRANLALNVGRTFFIAVVYLLLFQYIGGGIITNIPVAVINQANNQQSLQFISLLERQPSLHIEQAIGETQAMSLLQTGGVSAVVVIHSSFPQSSPSVWIYYSNNQPQVSSGAVTAVEAAAAKFTGPSGYIIFPSSKASSISISTPVNSASGN